MKPFDFQIIQDLGDGLIDVRTVFVLANNIDEATSHVRADYKNLLCATPIMQK